MERIPTQQLLKELKEIEPSIELVPNLNRSGLSNFRLNGQDIGTAVPSDFLQLEKSPNYIYSLPNGWEVPLKTYAEAKGLCESILLKLKDENFSKEFFQTDEK